MTVDHTYTLTFEGNDLETKNVQRLSEGDDLTVSRIADEEDTYEMLLTSMDGKEIGILDYGDSIGVAPYMDTGEVGVVSSKVRRVTVLPGNKRAEDRTLLEVDVSYSYGESVVPENVNGGLMFLSDNIVLQAAAERYLGTNKLAERPYLNVYEYSGVLGTGERSGESIFLRVLFNETFTKCRFSAEVGGEGIELDDDEKDAFIELVNHRRYFLDEGDPAEPEYDD